jgi:hypothetical protein
MTRIRHVRFREELAARQIVGHPAVNVVSAGV